MFRPTGVVSRAWRGESFPSSRGHTTLTNHSSRTRIAASFKYMGSDIFLAPDPRVTGRLNSSVMRYPIFIAVLFLASCRTAGPLPHVAYEFCPTDPATWQVLSAPPNNAVELLAIAKPELGPVNGRTPTLYWFTNGADSILLCRTMVDRSLGSCGSQTWQFQPLQGQWQLQDDVSRVIVCG
jgi:hypothetical protein